MKLIPTILCGGAGSRLWPVSRELHPKPFIRLADGQSLLQKASLRGAMLPKVTEVLTVTNRELFFKTEDEYREVAGCAPAGLPNSFDLGALSAGTPGQPSRQRHCMWPKHMVKMRSCWFLPPITLFQAKPSLQKP